MKYGQNLMLVTIFQRKLVQSSEKPEKNVDVWTSLSKCGSLIKDKAKLKIGIPLWKSKIFGWGYFT